jgi:hypothetical protein
VDDVLDPQVAVELAPQISVSGMAPHGNQDLPVAAKKFDRSTDHGRRIDGEIEDLVEHHDIGRIEVGGHDVGAEEL